MTQKKRKESMLRSWKHLFKMILSLLLVTGMLTGMLTGFGSKRVYAEEANANAASKKLQNGSFENGSTYWSTTALHQKYKFEIFEKNTSQYIPHVTLTPTDGKYAAELNAEEESTLYQNVSTTPSSVYEWGLDHGARNGADTMALVIGPRQEIDPSKPDINGRDQFMQMADWLISKGLSSVKKVGQDGIDPEIIVYSKKFAANGTFADNAGNNAFSLTPSSIYTEEWHIWIIADSKSTSGENKWGHYGSNSEGASTGVDKNKYYQYTVPTGQTQTVFGFVSVGYDKSATVPNKAKTYGNFLDNINFQIYEPLSASSTAHGSATVTGSDGKSATVDVNNRLDTYVVDGEAVTLQATITAENVADGCEFAGVYYTKQDASGNPVTVFLQNGDGWTQSTNENGDMVYTYSLEAIDSATDLHFIFVKNPTVTYDSNGGKPYVVDSSDDSSTTETANVYSFKPNGDTFVAPYTSHAAEGQNDGWKFMGWLLTGDQASAGSGTVVGDGQLGSLILPAEHTIACDYSSTDASAQSAAQYFKIYNGTVSLAETDTTSDTGEKTGVTWTGDATPVYANTHRGLTLVAQWRWLQAFIPQIDGGTDNAYVDSETGGTVTITSVTDSANENYNSAYNENGAKAYFAQTNEEVTVTAAAKDSYTFEGWYDESGNLITTKETYSYTETKESVNTYYARFSGSITQKYIRQIKDEDGETWKDITDDTIAILGRYEYIDAPGKTISSTAEAANGYKFIGWYDAEGNEVSSDMLINEGKTISYTTTVDATYYARFEKLPYTVKFVAQTKQADGTFKDDTSGGTVSLGSQTGFEKDGNVVSTATAAEGATFLGWYDADGKELTTDAAYTTALTAETDGKTYYARFEFTYKTNVTGPVLSFVAESKDTVIPDAFAGRNAGTGINAQGYGLDIGYGNTISTGFNYSIDSMKNVSTIQITVTVPANAYVKSSGFAGNGAAILTDSSSVSYNQGSIQQISQATTLTYYWDATGLTADTTYGFIIDNLYASGATATITVNGTSGTKVTSANGVVNTASTDYRNSSHYHYNNSSMFKTTAVE